MYTTIRDDLIAERMLESEAKGQAEEHSDELRARLDGCKDEALRRRWSARAITATTLTEVFDD